MALFRPPQPDLKEPPPKKALIIFMGSGFNPEQEVGFGFMHELVQLGFTVDVRSLDARALPAAPVPQVSGISVIRMSVALNDESIEKLIDAGVNNYQKIILIDSLHYISSNLDLTKKMLAVVRDRTAAHPDIEISTLHYIGARNEEPTLNDRYMPVFNLGINPASFFDQPEYKNNPDLTLQKKIRGFQNTCKRIHSEQKEKADDVFLSYTKELMHTIFNPAIAAAYRAWLDLQVIQRVSLSMLQKPAAAAPAPAVGAKKQ